MISSEHAPRSQSSASSSSSSSSSRLQNTDTDNDKGNGKGKGRELSPEPTTATLSNVDAPRGRGRGRDKELYYRLFRSEEEDLDDIMRLAELELSEPYNIYTFRYFLIDWPHLAFLVFPHPHDIGQIQNSHTHTNDQAIGTILCKQDIHRGRNRGYIAMLSIDKSWRRKGIASELVRKAIYAMEERGANEIVLETEFDNTPSLALYEHLGFLREKRLHRFYSNGKDAFRLKLILDDSPQHQADDRGSGLDTIYEYEDDRMGKGTPRPSAGDLPLPEAYGGMYI